MRVVRIFSLCIAECIVAVLSVCEAYAQTDITTHLLDSLLVTDERQRFADIESSAPMQRLLSEELENLGTANVGDALKYMSGVTVKDYGGVGGIKTVSIRGMGAQHTTVFYDGVAVGDCQSGQVDLGRFSTDNLDAVQLTIGQGDDIYQSARMLASVGAVSLTGRSPSDDFMRVGVRAASFDTYQANLQFGRSLGKGWHARFFADYITSDGNYDFDIKKISSVRKNSDVESLRGEANISWTTTRRHTLNAKLYGYYSSRGVPGAVIVDNPLSSERLVSQNIFGQLFYEYIPDNTLRMKVAFKHNYSGDRNRQPGGTAGSTTLYKYRQHETDLSYTLKFMPSSLSGFSFVWSEELFHNNLATNNRHLTMSSAPRRLTALSAASIRYVGRLFGITASLLHTYATEWASKGYVAPNRSRFSPSVALSFNPFGRNFTLRASYKDIFRLPTFNDLYYRETGNYKLNPEKSRMLNVGAAGCFASSGWLHEATFSLDGYYGHVEDKIVAVPGVFIWKMSNVDDVEMAGADANLSATIQFSRHERLKIVAAYSYMYAVNDTDGSSIKGHQIVYTPRHSGSLSAVLNSRLCNVGYSLLWSGKRYRLAQNIPSNEVEAYCDHSVWLARDWKIGRSMLTARIEAMNLAGKNYEIVRYYPMPGRNYRLSLNFKI